MIIQPEADPAQETVMRGFWFRLLVFFEAVGMACTASISRMIKSKKKFSKQMSHRNPPTVASPSLFGAWLTDTVTYHH